MTVPTTGATASRSRLVSRRDIELFTEISGDRNPLHYDEERAAASRFGGIVVQGGVTTACSTPWSPRSCPGRGACSCSSTSSSGPPSGPVT